MRYSFIIPVYNRPDEVDELLDSLTRQSVKDFEVIVVEDGSAVTCSDVCAKYANRLDLHYYNKPNSGPGQSRNYGVERAKGEYVLILDSDVVVPEGYLKAVNDELEANPADMGVRRDVYARLEGFSKMRFGEDIDFSIRIFKAGCRCRLFPEAWVWHKRRTDFRKFFRQVYNSGIARINLYKKYPESLKLVHLLPMVFTVGVLLMLVLCLVLLALAPEYAWLPVVPLVLYCVLIFFDSSRENHSVKIGVLSIASAYIQLMGYGFGFIESWWKRCVCGKSEFSAFEKTFYK